MKGGAHGAKKPSYKLLARVLKEQCEVSESSDDQPAVISPKPAKKVPSDSLQNPSDPDAAYSGHKGQGYQVPVMETYSENTDEADKEATLNLITYVNVEPDNESDANALLPAIDSAAKLSAVCPPSRCWPTRCTAVMRIAKRRRRRASRWWACSGFTRSGLKVLF